MDKTIMGGAAGERLHEWMLTTRWGHEMVGEPVGTGGREENAR